LRALLRELVDYAGLFPPAGLPMEQAVRNYARYRVGQYAWALGRFVTSIARLDEFETAFAGLPPQTGCWRIAALLGDNPRADFASIQAFNERHAEVVMIDVIEAKTPSAAQISTNFFPLTSLPTARFLKSSPRLCSLSSTARACEQKSERAA